MWSFQWNLVFAIRGAPDAMESSDIIFQSLNFKATCSHLMNTLSQSHQKFPINQRRADEYVQLQGSIALIFCIEGCIHK